MDARTDPMTVAPSPVPTRLGGALKSMLFVILGIAAVALLAWWLTNRAKNADDAGPGGGPGAGAQGGGRGAKGAGGEHKPPSVVALATVVDGDIPVVRTALGTVTPLATVTVRPQVSGQIMVIAFQEGQLVRKGQLLAQVDQRPFQLALDQAKATLARDEALLQNARVDLDRYQTLLRQDSIASQQVTTQASTVAQQAAVVQADRATIGTAQLNVTYSHVTAPVSGRVGLRGVDVGNYVVTGQPTGIVTLTQTSPIDVAFTLPEDQVPAVEERVSKGVSLLVTIYDRARTRPLAQGRLLTLDNQVDVTTGTLKAKARFANADGLLIPNQFVNVDLTVSTLSGVAVAPAAAFRHGTQGDYAYVVTPDRVAHVRVVQLGTAAGDIVAVLGGLKAGEQVVIEGGDRLVDGAKVMLPADKPPAGVGGKHRHRGG